MVLRILLSSYAFASDIPEAPTKEVLEDQLECAITALSPGQPFPQHLLDSEGNLKCGGVIVPATQATYWYKHEAWAKNQLLPRLEASYIELEHERRLREMVTPKPWERPGVQRTIGAAQVAVVGAAAVILFTQLQKASN